MCVCVHVCVNVCACVCVCKTYYVQARSQSSLKGGSKIKGSVKHRRKFLLINYS